MSGQTINYEHLAREALRSVVRAVLMRISEDGLPGDHHFYISFHTTAPDVKISSRISAQYPKEMTIVLQHQFWDLKIEEDYFEVRLSFSNKPELLVIPYSAVKVFFDPSVPYGLQFDQNARPEAVEDKSTFIDDQWHASSDSDEIPMSDIQDITASDQNNIFGQELMDDQEPELDEKPIIDEEGRDASSEQKEGDGADIVSLDAFRKKNN